VPIIQLPADVMATQEVIWSTKPDVIVETGVARGGSVIFLASMLELIGKGLVIGVDIDIRPHNRSTIETHPLAKRITLIEGSSEAPATLDRVKSHIPAGATVMAILDSNHSRDHVLAELRCYAPLVTAGCFLVVADTALGFLRNDQVPTRRSQVLHRGNEPLAAVAEFLRECNRFAPDPLINSKLVLASSPGGYLRCLR
jgi:cephalosporin hydroxylase